MPDDFQQIKGFLGQQIAKFHLEKTRGYKIVDEEVKVEGVDGRARLDIVIQRSDSLFSPVEVKCQEYRVTQYGKAFEYVLKELGYGQPVYGIDREERRLRLSQPILYLWFPPSSKITVIPFYSAIEVVTFETALQEIKRDYGDQFIEEMVKQIESKVKDFFDRGCTLTEQQRRCFEKLFPSG